MQTQNKLLDDLARVASGAIGVAAGMREEVEARLRDQFERVLERFEKRNGRAPTSAESDNMKLFLSVTNGAGNATPKRESKSVDPMPGLPMTKPSSPS